jgi:circadian clock protein KaiB
MLKKMKKKTKPAIVKKAPGLEIYVFRLFVTGILPNSVRAVINSKAICEKFFKGRYELEIIDIYQQPAMALSEEIIAIPVLVKRLPLPEARVIGDLSNSDEVLKGLNIISTETATS